MGRWYFLRHGESFANAEGWLSGWTDVALTPRGEAQADEAGARLATVSFERALCSDLRRARDTARRVLAASTLPCPPLQESLALRERDLGRWQGVPLADVRGDQRIHTLLSWSGRPEQGESQADMAARALPFLASLPAVEGPTLLVAHGGLNRVLLGLLDETPLEEIGKHKLANAAIEVREIAPGRFAALAARYAGAAP